MTDREIEVEMERGWGWVGSSKTNERTNRRNASTEPNPKRTTSDERAQIEMK